MDHQCGAAVLTRADSDHHQLDQALDRLRLTTGLLINEIIEQYPTCPRAASLAVDQLVVLSEELGLKQ